MPYRTRSAPAFLARRGLVLLFPVLAGLINLPAGAQETAGWVFEQYQESVGPQIASLSEKALHCSYPQLGLQVILSTTDNQITLINDKRKLYFRMPAGEWMRVQERITNSKERDKYLVFARSKEGRIANLRVTEYVGYREPLTKPRPNGLVPLRTNQGPERQVWLAPDIKPPRAFAELVCRVSRLPPEAGLPLRIVRYNSRGKSYSLDTSSARKSTFPASLFQVPKGYKIARDEMELAVDLPEQSELSLFLDHLADPDIMKPPRAGSAR